MAYMDENEIKRVISIDTGDSLSILKDYKIKIDELKKSLDSLDKSSKEYKSTTEQIADMENTLNNLMSVSKDKLNAANDAYEKVADSVQDLKDKLDDVNNAGSKMNLNSKIDVATSSLKNLSSETESSSSVFEDLGDTATNIFQKSIDDSINKVITSSTGFNSTLGTVIKTMYQTGKAALKAGKDMATAEAMATAGITLIIDAIILCIAYWDEISAAASKAIDWVKDLIGIQPEYTEAVYDSETAWNNLNDKIEMANSALSFHLELMKAQGKSELEIVKYKQQSLKTQLDLAKAERSAAANQGVSEEEYKKFDEQVKSLQRQYRAAQDQEILARVRAENEANNKIERSRVQHHTNINKKTKDHTDREAEQREKQAQQILDRLHKENTDELVLLQEKYEEEKKLLEAAGKSTVDLTKEYEKNRREVIIKEREKLQEELEKDLKTSVSDLDRGKQTSLDELDIKKNKDIASGATSDKDDITLQQEELDAKFEIEQEYYNKRIELQQSYLENFLGSEEQKKQAEQELDDLRREFTKRQAEYEAKQTENAKKAAKQQKKDKEQALMATLNTAGDVFGSLSELSEENSEAAKLFSIMETTMSTLTGAINAYKSMAGIPYVGPALGIAAAAAVTAAGIANINKIKSTTKDNAASQLSSESMPQLSMTNVSPLLDETADTNRMTTLNEQGVSATEQQNLRVYVVDQDIRDANKKAEVVEDNTTF